MKNRGHDNERVWVMGRDVLFTIYMRNGTDPIGECQYCSAEPLPFSSLERFNITQKMNIPKLIRPPALYAKPTVFVEHHT